MAEPVLEMEKKPTSTHTMMCCVPSLPIFSELSLGKVLPLSQAHGFLGNEIKPSIILAPPVTPTYSIQCFYHYCNISGEVSELFIHSQRLLAYLHGVSQVINN